MDKELPNIREPDMSTGSVGKSFSIVMGWTQNTMCRAQMEHGWNTGCLTLAWGRESHAWRHVSFKDRKTKAGSGRGQGFRK